MTDPAAVVRRYFEVVADLNLSSPEDALLGLLDPAVRIVEHPNAINPSGGVRDRDGAVAGFLAGKRLLSAQSIEVHEILVSGNRVAVRATSSGTIRDGTEAFPAGRSLVAHVAALLTVSDDRLIREHETFACYEPS